MKLLSKWTVQQLENNRIAYPVSEHIVSRWMRESGFSYMAHKKTYYVDMHEDEDVITDRNAYLKKSFELEIFEECWIQLPRRKYISMKCLDTIRTIGVKKEELATGLETENVSDKVSEYIDEKRVHFYKDENGRDMTEIHVDDVYSYDAIEINNLPSLASKGGNASVRLPKGSKPKIIFGQDEAIFRSSQLNDSCN